MVREPRAFLLDEPLSNLDPTLRAGTRAELARLQRRLHATVLHVTHDQEEAMTLGHRVAVMSEGRVQQVAPPLTLYREPVNLFVAGFVGSPPMNLIPGTVTEGGFRGAGIELPGARPPRGVGGPVVLGVRPHDLRCERDGREGSVAGTVELVEPLGSETILHVAAAGADRTLTVVVPPERAPARGERVFLVFPPGRLHWFEGGGARVA
jgi:ABC-type sugar transport system ATPase subunit